MRSIFASLSIIVCIIGFIFLLRGWFHPFKYKEELSKETTTAVRVAQVYTEATYIVVVGIGFFSSGILIAFIGVLTDFDKLKALFSRFFTKTEKKPANIKEIEPSQPGRI